MLLYYIVINNPLTKDATMEDIKNHALPIRLLSRLADQACAADDVDTETKKYNEEELKISPLHVAAFNGSVEKVKELLKNKVDVNIQDKLEWTPLHDAVIQGHTEIVKLLLSAGANVQAQDLDDLYTPLHDAVRMNYPDIVELLLSAGANPSIEDRWNNSAFDVAQEYNFQDILKLLQEK